MPGTSDLPANPGGRDFVLCHLTLPHLLPPEFISAAAEAGYQGVSLRLIPANPPDERQLPMFGASPLLAETLARMRATGVYVGDIEVLKLEAEVDMAGLERVLETGARLSARNLIAIAPDGVESRVVDNLGRVAELSASYGVRTCLESMIYMGVKTMAQASRIIDQTGRGDIGMVIDPLHLDRASDRVADVAGLDPARIASIQLCDAGPRPDPSDLETLVFESRTQRLIPGTGTLPLQELLRVIPAGVPVELEVPTVGLIGTMPDAEIAAMMRDAALAILAAG